MQQITPPQRYRVGKEYIYACQKYLESRPEPSTSDGSPHHRISGATYRYYSFQRKFLIAIYTHFADQESSRKTRANHGLYFCTDYWPGYNQFRTAQKTLNFQRAAKYAPSLGISTAWNELQVGPTNPSILKNTYVVLNTTKQQGECPCVKELTAGSDYILSNSLSKMLTASCLQVLPHNPPLASVCQVPWSKLIHKNNNLLTTVIFSNVILQPRWQRLVLLRLKLKVQVLLVTTCSTLVTYIVIINK